jgi:hypothetical protein
MACIQSPRLDSCFATSNVAPLDAKLSNGGGEFYMPAKKKAAKKSKAKKRK